LFAKRDDVVVLEDGKVGKVSQRGTLSSHSLDLVVLQKLTGNVQDGGRRGNLVPVLVNPIVLADGVLQDLSEFAVKTTKGLLVGFVHIRS
jgi:hypothetical protein